MNEAPTTGFRAGDAIELRDATRILVESPLEAVRPLELGERFLDGLEHLLPASRLGLHLVEPESFEFRLSLVRPHSAWAEMDRLALEQIEQGAFADAIRAGRPTSSVLAGGRFEGLRLLLVPVSTGPSVTGMAVAILEPDDDPPDAALVGVEVLATVLASRIDGHRERHRADRAITERRGKQEEVDRLNLNLERSIFRLRRLEQDRDDLTRMIVHDLRTPMTSVKTTLDMLSSGMMGSLQPEELEMVEIANQSGDRLLGMVSDLLDISKFEAGELRPDAQEVDLIALADSAAASLEPLARLEEKALRVERTDGPHVARADPELVRRVVENLIGNALRFSPAGSTIHIGVHGPTDSGHLELAVRDEGEGIPAEYLDRIFQKFVQVEGRRNGKKLGTGLGLTFCRLATEAQGGTIRVESEPGQGSTFFVSYPVPRI